MTDSIAYELLARVVSLPIRILTSEATEEPDFSSQRLRCKILRDDVEDGAVALIFAAAVLSFHDARPRGTSHIDYIERDEWTPDDLCRHLHFSKTRPEKKTRSSRSDFAAIARQVVERAIGEPLSRDSNLQKAPPRKSQG